MASAYTHQQFVHRDIRGQPVRSSSLRDERKFKVTEPGRPVT